jgi:hypothetical protein
MIEGILNHLPCGIVEDKVGFVLAKERASQPGKIELVTS